MWFKNVVVFQLHNQTEIGFDELQERLQAECARPLGNADARRVGWTTPAGRVSHVYVHESQGYRLISLLQQDRILPASVIKEELEEQVAEIEDSQGRKVTRGEKIALKEQIVEELLPRAFVRTKKIDACWDTQRQRIYINTGSRAAAELLLDLLRETLGSLKATPLSTQTLPIRAMTQWVSEAASRPANLQLGDKVTLKAKGDDGKIAATQIDIDTDDIQQLLASGRQAAKLAITLDERLSATLDDTLALKGLRFSDALIEQADHADDGDDPIARLESDFFLMAAALAESVDSLIAMLGGATEHTPTSETDTRPDDAHLGEKIGDISEGPDQLLLDTITLANQQGGKITGGKLMSERSTKKARLHHSNLSALNNAKTL